MTKLEFLNKVALARIVCDNNQRSRDSAAQEVVPGNYRILNQGSQRCLSYSSRPAAQPVPGTIANLPTVTGWSCGIPEEDDDLHQVRLSSWVLSAV